MRLLLYSGGYFEHNIELDLELLKLTGKVYPSLTYIPASSDFGPKDFQEFVKHYEHYDFSYFHYFPVDLPFTTGMAKEALQSDIIYLSGGNTFHFLYHLRKTGFLHDLRHYVKEGGTLAGLSAGAIMFTPNINTASFPSFDCDENDMNMTDLNALHLVNFEFFPHYTYTKRYDEELRKYSVKLEHPLYAVPDNSGIIVEDHKLSFVGDVFGYFGGMRFKVG